jgi:hypothetical protein
MKIMSSAILFICATITHAFRYETFNYNFIHNFRDDGDRKLQVSPGTSDTATRNFRNDGDRKLGVFGAISVANRNFRDDGDIFTATDGDRKLHFPNSFFRDQTNFRGDRQLDTNFLGLSHNFRNDGDRKLIPLWGGGSSMIANRNFRSEARKLPCAYC